MSADAEVAEQDGTEESPIVWSVAFNEVGEMNVTFGPKLSAAGFTDDTKLQILGRSLVQLGTRLLTSTVVEDGLDDEEPDE